MDHPTAPPDHSFLDIENMTSEEWRSLIYNRVIKQKDVFIDSLKSKIIKDINECIKTVSIATTLDKLQIDLTSKVNENNFEFEFQKFVDGIVGVTFEYVCQLIIKNSLENIKRTQNALNSFSLTSNTNCDALQPYCSETMNLQESSFMSQIQCLPESNNNTTDSGKMIHLNLFNNSLQNITNSSMISEKGNYQNNIVDKLEPTIHNRKYSLQKNNLPLPTELTLTNERNIISNYIHNNHTIVHPDEEDDVKTTAAIVSLAMKITEQEVNLKFADGFEDEKCINSKYENIRSEIQTNNLIIEQIGDRNSESHKLEEEFKMNNSLKILESLVNIEHNKLEVQKVKFQAETELDLSNIENEKEHGNIYKTRNVQNKKSQWNIIRECEEYVDDCIPNKSLNNKTQKKNSNNDIKLIKITKPNGKILCKNYLKNTRYLFKDLKIGETSYSLSCSSNKESKTKVLHSSSSKIFKESQYVKEHLSSCELKTHLSDVSSSINKKECNKIAVNYDNDSLLIKNNIVPSTSSLNKKDGNNVKIRPSCISNLVQKTSYYKKLYEKERKSLFSPDIIIRSKPMNDSTNNITKEKKNRLPVKNLKPRTCKLQTNKSSGKKKKSNNHDCINVKRAKDKPKSPKDTMLINSSNSLNQKSLNKSVTVKNKSMFKRQKIKHNYGNENNTIEDRIDINTETKTKQNNMNNNVSQNVDLSKIENPEIEQLNTDTLTNDSSIKLLLQKYSAYNLKPLYVVIDPNKIYL